MSLNIGTFNVKGLASREKRLKIFEFLKQKKFDISLLQEVHCKDVDSNSWRKEWGGDIFLSGRDSNSKGVGILINPNLDFKCIDYKEIIQGRLQVLKLEIRDTIYVILNVYGPNNEDITFFKKLEETVISYNSETLIAAGDFNVVLDYNIDKLNGKKNTN